MMRGAALYVGETAHARVTPTPHRFRYRFFQLLVDVDRLDTAFTGLATIRQGRFGLFSFTARDHGLRDGSPLRAWVLARLAETGIEAEARRIQLLCFPRVLGFVFNPLSIFFVHGADERLEAVIYEVNNTFGQTHAYVAPATGAAVERQQADKAFFVSPFYGVDGGYRFHITAPGEAFELAIVKQREGKADFTATVSARRRALTDRALLGLFFSMPLMTLGVVAGIHWQALRLWAKGVRLQARPPGPRAGVSTARTVAAP
jgi:DUF1365 family protein